MKGKAGTRRISTAWKIIAGVLCLGLFTVPAAAARAEKDADPTANRTLGDDSGHLDTEAGPEFITIAPNERFFQFPDGRPFVPVGHNETFDKGLLLDPERLDAYFSNMRENGENVLRLLLDGWSDSLVELRVGQFSPLVDEVVDNLVAAAEANGIYLIISMWISVNEYSVFPTFVYAWSQHPYNLSQPGGLVRSALELLSDDAAREAQKNRILHFVERWGHSPNIFAWELWNEIDAMKKDQSSDSVDTLHETNLWIDEMGKFIREAEEARFGEHHLRTVSVSNAGWGSQLSGVFTGDELDFTSYHTYDNWLMVGVDPWSGARGQSPLDPDMYFKFTYESARMAVTKSGFRPVLGTEDAPMSPQQPRPPAYQGFTSEQLDDLFIGTIWTSVLGGGGGGNLRWTSNVYGEGEDAVDGYRGLSNGMLAAQRAMADILTDPRVNWGSFYADFADDQVVDVGGEADLNVMALSDGGIMLVLLIDQAEAFDRSTAQTTLRFQNLKDEGYKITWYDPRTGAVLGRQSPYGAAFTVRTPPFQTFLVGVVEGRFAVGKENHPPKAKIVCQEWVYPGGVLTISGRLSTDVDGDPLNFHWEQVGGPKIDTVAKNDVDQEVRELEFTADVEDEYEFSLKVFDGKYWSNVDYARIQVSADGPAGCAPSSTAMRRRAMHRSDLLFVTLLFVPALVTLRHWKKQLSGKGRGRAES